MSAPVTDVSSLPGKVVSDQMATPIGEVKDIFSTDDGFPMWIRVEVGPDSEEDAGPTGPRQSAFIPLARLKEEHGDLCVPYSKGHICHAPQVEDGERISAEDDRALRAYYGIDTGDQELRADNKSYATLVPDESAESKRADDASRLETPDADKRTDDTHKRRLDPGSSEIRHITAEDVVTETNTR